MGVALLERDGRWWEWFIRGLTFGGSGLIRGVTFGGSGLLRGVTFGGSGLIRGGLMYKQTKLKQ